MIFRRTRQGEPTATTPGRDVVRDDAPGPDHRVVADRHALHHDRVASDPDVVADGNGQRTHDARVALVGQQGVVDGVDADVRPDEDVVADGDGRFVEDRQVEIADEMVADRNLRSEIAVERAVDADRLADVSEQLPDDRLPLLPAARGSWLSRNTSSSVRSSAPPISGQMAWSQSPAFIFSRSPMIRWLLGGGSGFSNRKKHTPLPRCASLSDIPCYSETIASLGHTPAQVPQSIHLVGVDHIDVAGRNSLYGALADATAACNARVGNFVSHCVECLLLNVCVQI